MIILKGIHGKYQQSVQVELPHANMVIDPRPNNPFGCGKFRCIYHDSGTTVTLTMDEDTDDETFEFRVYDPATETVPSFDSTIYTYLGVDGEKAPIGRTETVRIIHPSVTVIKKNAFSSCWGIKKFFMHDGLYTIEEYAFAGCEAMKMIRLSRSLTHIGEYASHECHSLEAIFLPPSVNKIDKCAFAECHNLRILPLEHCYFSDRERGAS